MVRGVVRFVVKFEKLFEEPITAFAGILVLELQMSSTRIIRRTAHIGATPNPLRIAKLFWAS